MNLPSHILEVFSKRGHCYVSRYSDPEKAQIAAKGFHEAMKTAPDDTVISVWRETTLINEEGVCPIKVPHFSIRAGEVSSVSLLPWSEWSGPALGGFQMGEDPEDNEGESWKS